MNPCSDWTINYRRLLRRFAPRNDRLRCFILREVSDLFIGQVVETYGDDSRLTDGIVDFSKVHPILFVMNDRGYYRLGEHAARAWEIGKILEKR